MELPSSPVLVSKYIRWAGLEQSFIVRAQPVISREHVHSPKPSLKIALDKKSVAGAHVVAYIIPNKRNFIRPRVSPSDEANSNHHGKNAQDGRCSVIQTPCLGNCPRPRNQNESSDDAGQFRVCNRKCDTSRGGVSQHILVVLRLNRCQNNPRAHRNSNPHCAIGFALTLACLAHKIRPSRRSRSIDPRQRRTYMQQELRRPLQGHIRSRSAHCGPTSDRALHRIHCKRA